MLHCTHYDELLQAALPHFNHYPQLLPHIGNAWHQQAVKIIFIAESHYLPDTCNAVNKSETWYNNAPIKLTDWDKTCITTRRVVRLADNYLVTGEAFNKSFQIFYSLKNGVFDQLGVKNRKQTLFQHFGYYNYFQRPAEKTGESIINCAIDDRVAYDTFKAICHITGPTAVIFVSQKAYKSFKSRYAMESKEIFKHIAIQNIVHPATSWWNRKNNKLSANGLAETGREKFMRTLGVYKFKLPERASY